MVKVTFSSLTKTKRPLKAPINCTIYDTIITIEGKIELVKQLYITRA